MHRDGMTKVPTQIIKLLQRHGITGHLYVPKPRRRDAAGQSSTAPAIKRKILLLHNMGKPIDPNLIAQEYGVTSSYVRSICKRILDPERRGPGTRP